MAAKTASLTKQDFEYVYPLEEKAKVKVKEDETVAKEDVLAEVKEKTTHKLNLSSRLKVKGKETLQCLVKELGEEVEKDELIAEKKTFFGPRKFYSPCSGKLDSLTEEGVLTINSFKKRIVKSELDGKVMKITSSKLVVKTKAVKTQGNWGLGSPVLADLAVLVQTDSNKSLFKLGPDVKDKILVIRGKPTQGFWFKANSLGVRGLVCGYLPSGGFKKFLIEQKERLEKQDDFFPSILVLGKKKIKQKLWKKIKKHQEKTAFLDGDETSFVLVL